MRKVVTYAARSLLALIVLVALAGLLTQTAWFRARLRDILTTQLSEVFNGTLAVDEIQGNLFSSVTVVGCALIQDADTVVSCRSLTVSYDLAALFSNEVRVHAASLNGVKLNLRQMPDTTWNVARLLRPTSGDTTSSPWRVFADTVHLVDAETHLFPLDTSAGLPSEVRVSSLHGSVSVAGGDVNALVRYFHVLTRRPDLDLECTEGEVSVDARGVHVKVAQLRTPGSRVSGEAHLASAGIRNSLRVRCDPLDLAEVGLFAGNIPVAFRPTLEAVAEWDSASAEMDLRVADATGKLTLRGHVRQLASEPVYSVEGSFEHLNLATWVGSTLPASDLTGDLAGTGSFQGSPDASVDLRLAPSSIADWHIGSSTLEATYRSGRANARFDFSCPFGRIHGSAQVIDPERRRAFTLRAMCESLDLAQIAHEEGLRSDLNADVRATGAGFDFDTLWANVELDVWASSFMGHAIDSLRVKGSVRKGEAFIDTCVFGNSAVTAGGSLRAALGGGLSGRCSGLLHGAGTLADVAGADTLHAEGAFSGEVVGTLDSLGAYVRFDLEDVQFDAARARRARGEAALDLRGGDPTVHATIHADTGGYGPNVVTSLDLEASFSGGVMEGTLDVRFPGDVRIQTKARVLAGDTTAVTIPSLALAVADEQWGFSPDTASVTIAGGHVEVHRLVLRSDSGMLSVEGSFGGERDTGIRLTARGGQLALLSLVLRDTISGRLDIDALVHGTSDNPNMSASVFLRDATYRRFRVGDIRGRLSWEDSAAGWDITLRRPTGNVITSDGWLPLEWISAAGGESAGRHPRARVRTERFNLLPLSSVSRSLDEVHGILTADMSLGEREGKYKIEGTLTVDSGKVVSRSLGMAYDSLTLRIRAEGDTLRLERLSARTQSKLEALDLTSTQGTVELHGVLGIADSLFVGTISPVALSLKARDFQLFDSPRAEASINADISVTSSGGELVTDGTVDIMRSRWSLPQISGKTGGESASRPMLLQALQSRDTAAQISAGTKPSGSPLAVGRPVRGRIRVEIPRGTWLEARAGQVELYGTLYVVGKGGDPELEGRVDVARGNFTIFGFRFTVNTGHVTFQGGSAVDPILDLEVEHVFRTPEQEKKTLLTRIQGLASAPEVRFIVDNRDIPSEEAMSYLLFGTSSPMSASQQGELSGRANELVDNMTSSLISARLSATMGKSMGLDVVELRGSDNWTKASFTAGKYVTEDVYVSYEKGFGHYDANETAPEVFTFEYEILRSLWLQLVGGNSTKSGADLIFKFY